MLRASNNSNSPQRRRERGGNAERNMEDAFFLFSPLSRCYFLCVSSAFSAPLRRLRISQIEIFVAPEATNRSIKHNERLTNESGFFLEIRRRPGHACADLGNFTRHSKRHSRDSFAGLLHERALRDRGALLRITVRRATAPER